MLVAIALCAFIFVTWVSAQPARHTAAESSANAAASAGIAVAQITAPIAPEVPYGDRTITIVRVDLRRFALGFIHEARDGRRRSLPDWVSTRGWVGGINAGMFLPNGRPCGTMIENDVALSTRAPSSFRNAIAFAPRNASSPGMAVGGEGCDATQRELAGSHRSLLSINRLVLDCQGRPTSWRTKRYSSALFGTDDQGRAVFVHTRTPYRMHILGRMLASMHLGLRALAYMEGGPEASLVVRDARVAVSEMGSYEDDFFEDDSNQRFWDLPNVIGFYRR